MRKLLFRSFFHSRHSCSSSQFPLIAIVGIYLFSFGVIYSFSLFYPDVEKKARSHFLTPQTYFLRKYQKAARVRETSLPSQTLLTNSFIFLHFFVAVANFVQIWRREKVEQHVSRFFCNRLNKPF